MGTTWYCAATYTVYSYLHTGMHKPYHGHNLVLCSYLHTGMHKPYHGHNLVLCSYLHTGMHKSYHGHNLVLCRDWVELRCLDEGKEERRNALAQALKRLWTPPPAIKCKIDESMHFASVLVWQWCSLF